MNMKPPETPFPRHWAYYIALKVMVLLIGAGIALYLFGVF
jgi:hypothetical protein